MYIDIHLGMRVTPTHQNEDSISSIYDNNRVLKHRSGCKSNVSVEGSLVTSPGVRL